jgi:uncharacterized repeat protein (TIGR01451 family)
LLASPSSILASTALARALQQQDSDVPSDAEQAMFTKGQNLYLSGRYEQAVSVLQDFLKTYPRSIITDLTLLWLGRSYMQMGRIPEAEQIGQRLRSIKDTPFADIYESELQSARREAPARTMTGTEVAQVRPTETRPPATPTPTPNRTAARNLNSNTAARQPQSQPSPTPRPSQTANRPSLVINNNANTGSTRERTTTTTPPPVARRITSRPPVINSATNSSAAAGTGTALDTGSRRLGGRRRGRRAPVPSVAPPTVIANQNTAIQPQSNMPSTTAANQGRNRRNQTNAQPATRPPVTQPRQQVATNNPPRIIPRPTPTPTPFVPSNTNDNTAIARAETPVTPYSPPAATEMPANTSGASTQGAQGGLSVTVKQMPSLTLALRRASEFASPGQAVQIPLTVTNTGNKEDQFYLETDLPAEYQPSFSLGQGASDTGLPILVTPQLQRNASLEVMLNLRVPETASDGQQRRFIVRAASQSDYQINRLTDGSINIIAATLAADSRLSQTSVMPGESFTQTITVRNSGSAPAQRSRADFVFNPSFELVNASPSPLLYDRASRTAVWDLGSLASRDSRDITVTLRAVPNALAATSALGRGTIRTQSLTVGSNFDSPSITVGKVPRARIDAVSVGLTATPGDSIYIPFVVRNPGNTPDSYELRITAPGAPAATIYADTNGDGQHQEAEPVVAQTASLEPQGGQYPVLLRVMIPSNTPDRQQYSYNVVARSLTSNRVASEANTVLTVATPRVRVRTETSAGEAAGGDTIFYRLVLVNDGSGLARNLVVTEILPDAFQFINSDPSLNPQDAPGNTQRFVWRVPDLAPGDTTVLRVTVRLRPNLPADAVFTTQHTLSYQDSNGNSYRGQ